MSFGLVVIVGNVKKKSHVPGFMASNLDSSWLLVNC